MFSATDLLILSRYTLKHPGTETSGLMLNAFNLANEKFGPIFEKAILNTRSDKLQIANTLTDIARYDQINLIFELLESEYSEIQSAAIFSLKLLSDGRALKPLERLMEISDLSTRKLAMAAYDSISANPVPINENKFYTIRRLSPLDDSDLDFADSIIDTEFYQKDISELVNLLVHKKLPVRLGAEQELLGRGQKIEKELFDSLIKIKPEISKGLIELISKYSNPTGARILIEWTKKETKYYSDAIKVLGIIGGEDAASHLLQMIIQKKNAYEEIAALSKLRNYDHKPLLTA